MFLREANYKLGDFILIERSHTILTWLLQHPMGAERRGWCYVVGNILVILPWHEHGPGYLRMEFHNHLRRLPIWNKTTFYCFASSLHQVISGRVLTNDMIEQLAVNAINLDSSKNIKTGIFRLGRHKIIADNDDSLSWQAIGIHNRVNCGACFLESDILLLDSKKEELNQVTRKSFYSELKLLPQWNKTSAWGCSETIRRCKDLKHDKIPSVTSWNLGPAKSLKSQRIPFTLSQSWKGERNPELYTPNNVRHKTEWKCLGELAIWAIAFVYNGLRMGVLLLKKMINHVARRWNFYKLNKETDSS